MKQKEATLATRTQIFDAASRIILQRGGNALTLDAVAQEAGMSKGGLLYHFPNKESLVSGMIERLIGEFDTAFEEELRLSHGDWQTAYIRASFRANPERDKISMALFAALANNPDLLKPLQERFIEWQGKAETTAVTPALGTVVRLAIDGLWLAELLGFAPPSPELREQVFQALLTMVQREA